MSWPNWTAAGGAPPVLNPAPPVSTPGVAAAPLPAGLQYTPEQWSQLQQQNWSQWAQWQQQYQQWQQQYGAEYQKSMTALAQQASAANVAVPPPLPTEPKPPPPTDDPPMDAFSYTTAPPPTQPPPLPSQTTYKSGPAAYNTIPDIRSLNTNPIAQQQGYSTQNPMLIQNKSTPQQQQHNYNQNQQHNVMPPQNYNQSQNNNNYNQPPNKNFNSGGNNNNNFRGQQNQGRGGRRNQNSRFDNNPPQQQQHQQQQQQQRKRSAGFDQDDFGTNKRGKGWQNQPQPQPLLQLPVQQPVATPQHPARPPSKETSLDELTEAEKKFDKQFSDWEGQFLKWKDQNAEHPDKQQYREYEKKWESWRAQLLERRELMKRKRLSLTASSPKVGGPATPQPVLQPQLPADIGGFGGPQQQQQQQFRKVQQPASQGYSKPPPDLNNEPLAFKQPVKDYGPQQVTEVVEAEPEDEGNGFLLNSSGAVGDGIPGLEGGADHDIPDESKAPVDENEKPGPDFDAISKGINNILGDRNLLNMLSMVSQNQNLNTDNVTTSFAKMGSAENVPPMHDQRSNQDFDDYSNHDGSYRAPPPREREFVNNFDDQTRSSFTMNANEESPQIGNNRFGAKDPQFGGGPNDRFGPKDGGPFGGPSDRFGPKDGPFGGPSDRFGPKDGPFGGPSDRFGPKDGSFGGPSDRFGPKDGSFGGPSDRFGPKDGSFGGPSDRFGPKDGSFGGPSDRCGPKDTTFGGPGDRFGPKDGSFGGPSDRFGPNDGSFGGPSDRFGPKDGGPFGGPSDRFPRKDGGPFGGPSDRFGSKDGPFGGPSDRFPPKAGGAFGGPSDRLPPKDGPPSDRFGSRDAPFGGPSDRFPPRDGGPSDRSFGGPGDRFKPKDGFGGPSDRFPAKDAPPFGGPSDRFAANKGPSDRFAANKGPSDRFPPKNAQFGGSNQNRSWSENRFGAGPRDRFDEDFFDEPEQGGPRGPNNNNNNNRWGDGSNQGPHRGPPNNNNKFPGDNSRNNNNRSGGPRGGGGNNFQGGRFDRQDYNEYEGDDQYGNFDDYSGGNQDQDNFYEDDPNFGEGDEFYRDEGQWDEPMEQPVPEPEVVEEPVPVPEEPEEEILEPATVIDYDHKPLKSDEMEILVEPLFMFDYRHKTLSRIPLPDRPKWLADVVRSIPQFNPPLVLRAYDPPTQNLRNRYPPPQSEGPNWRRNEPPQGRYYDDRDRDRGGGNRRNYSPPPSHFESGGPRRPLFEHQHHPGGPPPSHRHEEDFDRMDHRRRDDREHGRQQDDSREHRHDEGGDRNNDHFNRGGKNFNKPSWHSKDEDRSSTSKHEGDKSLVSSNNNQPVPKKINAVLIEDLISPPGRYSRPPRIVIILRGPPGSGKTYLAKLIKDKEVENGGSPPRILSLDDYFMVEQEKEITENDKIVKVKEMVYEYEREMEESYRTSLVKSFKKTITDGYFSFIIVDNVNEKVKHFGEMWSFAKQSGFQVYICQLFLDVQACTKRNIHGRSEEEIEKCISEWEQTPAHHPTLDATSLLQSASIVDVEMEEVNSPECEDFGQQGEDEEDKEDAEGEDQVSRSKWDNFDCSNDNLAKLDGVSKPLRHRTMEQFLQMESDWTPHKPTKPGQKRVRWADLEEQEQQEKMRAIGFVVGQTNWDRMLDPTKGGSALTQTKYIEKTGRFKVDQMRQQK